MKAWLCCSGDKQEKADTFCCILDPIILTGLLGIGDSQYLSAKATDERGRLVHRGKLGDGDVGGLVHTLPVLDLSDDT